MRFESVILLSIILATGTVPDYLRTRHVFLVLHHGDRFYVEAGWDGSPGYGAEPRMKDQARADKFEAILVEYDKPLRRLAFAYERDFDLQKDLLQEIKLALWRALPTFRGHSSERTFIYRIAHNRALTHIARRHPEQLELAVALELPDTSPDPEQIMTSRLQEAELRARVAALPLTLRQVAMLALEGLSNRDMSEVLGITEGNVSVRLLRAKRRLNAGGTS